jgi:hypothetical protein
MRRPTLLQMLELDGLELKPEYRTFLQEWADALGVTVEILIGRIIASTIDGFLYVEKIPDYHPKPERVL